MMVGAAAAYSAAAEVADMKCSADAIKVSEQIIRRRIGGGEQILRIGTAHTFRRCPPSSPFAGRDEGDFATCDTKTMQNLAPLLMTTWELQIPTACLRTVPALAHVLNKFDGALIVTSASARPIGVTFVARA